MSSKKVESEKVEKACSKCESKAISETNDGAGLGVRSHCLNCGHIWKEEK